MFSELNFSVVDPGMMKNSWLKFYSSLDPPIRNTIESTIQITIIDTLP